MRARCHSMRSLHHVLKSRKRDLGAYAASSNHTDWTAPCSPGVTCERTPKEPTGFTPAKCGSVRRKPDLCSFPIHHMCSNGLCDATRVVLVLPRCFLKQLHSGEEKELLLEGSSFLYEWLKRYGGAEDKALISAWSQICERTRGKKLAWNARNLGAYARELQSSICAMGKKRQAKPAAGGEQASR